jgi:cell wall-associated NlpC family hydrolase
MKLLYDYALSFIGLPYIWGGDDAVAGFDCSGLVQELLAAIGADPAGDQNAQTLHDHFLANGKLGVMGLGALVFYGKSTKEISHIVMMLDDKSCIGADGGGSTTVDRAAAIKANAFVKVRPFDYRKDMVAIVMPDYQKLAP